MEKDTERDAGYRKRRKRESTSARGDWFSAKQLLMEGIPNNSDFECAQFVGILINHDVCLPRAEFCIGYENKVRDGIIVYTENAVMSFLCGDDTAAIQVTLRNEALASFQRQLDAMPPDSPIIMEMSTFRVSKLK